MAVYLTRRFERWARKEGIAASALCAAVREMAAGLFDADLGGSLYKKRVARTGAGKSGGYRTLVASNRGGRWSFLYGFPKNERSNIDDAEKEALKALAKYLLALPPVKLSQARDGGEILEIDCDA